MSSFVELLTKAAQEVNIIVGILFFTLGFVGNCSSIVILSSFWKIKVFPASPARIYLLTSAIADLIFVCYLLLTRLLISGFFIPVTNTINFMCKSRFYIGQICIFTSLFCSGFAIIDQFFVSSRSVRIRQLSRLSLAKIIVSISVLLWCLINIPALVLYNVYPKANGTSTVCTVYSSSWTFYYTYFQSLVFLCLVPLSIFIVFGILTRNNLRSVNQVHRSITRQMTRMIFIQTTTMALSLFIATVQIIYQAITLNTEKSTLRLAQENVFNTVANLLTYVNYIGGFYIYLYSSKSLRRSLKNALLNRREQTQTLNTQTVFKQDTTHHNQIIPITSTKH